MKYPFCNISYYKVNHSDSHTGDQTPSIAEKSETKANTNLTSSSTKNRLKTNSHLLVVHCCTLCLCYLGAETGYRVVTLVTPYR